MKYLKIIGVILLVILLGSLAFLYAITDSTPDHEDTIYLAAEDLLSAAIEDGSLFGDEGLLFSYGDLESVANGLIADFPDSLPIDAKNITIEDSEGSLLAKFYFSTPTPNIPFKKGISSSISLKFSICELDEEYLLPVEEIKIGKISLSDGQVEDVLEAIAKAEPPLLLFDLANHLVVIEKDAINDALNGVGELGAISVENEGIRINVHPSKFAVKMTESVQKEVSESKEEISLQIETLKADTSISEEDVEVIEEIQEFVENVEEQLDSPDEIVKMATTIENLEPETKDQVIEIISENIDVDNLIDAVGDSLPENISEDDIRSYLKQNSAQ